MQKVTPTHSGRAPSGERRDSSTGEPRHRYVRATVREINRHGRATEPRRRPV